MRRRWHRPLAIAGARAPWVYCVLGLSAVATLGLALTIWLGSASAHQRNNKVTVNYQGSLGSVNNQCVQVHPRLAHGNGGIGFSRTTTRSLLDAYGGGNSIAPCARRKYKQPYRLRTRGRYMLKQKKRKVCWVWSWHSVGVETSEVSLYKDFPNQNCGRGRYWTKGWGKVKWQGQWTIPLASQTRRHAFRKRAR